MSGQPRAQVRSVEGWIGRRRAEAVTPRGRTLLGACLAHALHDGYTDLIYVMLPVWQAQFALGYGALAVLRACSVGALAGLQLPATRLARRLGARRVLVLGTLLAAFGYALAGTAGGLPLLGLALLVAGAGSATQHPLASAVIARACPGDARGALGTYNFAGDLGKAAVPPMITLLLTLSGPPAALWTAAALGVAVALGVHALLPRDPPITPAPPPAASRDRAGGGDRAGFRLLVAIGMLDNAARPAFLLYLPFLLQTKGAALTTIGLAFSLVFCGGALGKAACGRLGARFGAVATVIVTETGTAALILAAIALPLAPALCVLPLLGVMLNGTSSVLYGSVPDLAPEGRVEHGFAVFYTWTLGGSALAAPLLFGRLGDLAGPHWAASAAALTALAVVPLTLWLGPRLAHARPAPVASAP